MRTPTCSRRVKPTASRVKPWRTDDYFYHAQGVAHVIHHLALALQAEYRQDFAGRPAVQTLLQDVADSLGEAATMKPLLVLDGAA